MSFYNNYIGPGVRYLTYIAFLATIVIFGLEIRKIYQSNCRIMIFDALGKPLIPAMLFIILFFWKNINEFVSRSALVGGDDDDVEQESDPEPEVVEIDPTSSPSTEED